MVENETQQHIANICESLRDLLLEKNRRYGNSALNPKKIFAKIEATDSICVRLDDKISRIQNSSELRKNDVADIMGYLVLLCESKGWHDFDDLID